MLNTKAILTLFVYLNFGNVQATHITLTGAGAINSSPPPSCSNSLDFTDNCNSQYVVLL